MNERADWISWSLHFALGFIIGPISVPLLGKLHIFTRNISPIFILGTCLIGAAIGSHYGDELWLKNSYRVIPPNAPKHSYASKMASLVIGCLGGLLAIVGLSISIGIL